MTMPSNTKQFMGPLGLAMGLGSDGSEGGEGATPSFLGSPAFLGELPNMPKSPGAPPVLGSNPTRQKKGQQAQKASFLGATTTPTQSQLGSKSLIGT